MTSSNYVGFPETPARKRIRRNLTNFKFSLMKSGAMLLNNRDVNRHFARESTSIQINSESTSIQFAKSGAMLLNNCDVNRHFARININSNSGENGPRQVSGKIAKVKKLLGERGSQAQRGIVSIAHSYVTPQKPHQIVYDVCFAAVCLCV